MTMMRTRRVSRGPVIAVMVAAAVTAVTVGVLSTRDDGTKTVAVRPAAQVSSLQQGCQRWLTEMPGQVGTSAWCTGMGDWLTGQMGGAGMGPQMMWGNPEQMRATCRRWMTDEPPLGGATATSVDWCDSMVSWMSENMGSWSGRGAWQDWMAKGPMMGR